jgi:hypothetical protein
MFNMRNRLTELDGKESAIIRALGIIFGVISIMGAPFLYWEGTFEIHELLGSIFLGILFTAYGIGGSKLFLKILPTTHIRKL